MTTSPTNLRLIVFDLGKVLVEFDYRIAARHLSQHTHLSPEQLIDSLLHSPLLLEYERGEMSNEDFYQALVRKTGLHASFEEFATRFGDIFSPIQPMLELLDRVQSSGRPTALLSNTNDLAIRHIRSHYPFFNRFQYHVLSFEHRAMKPDPALYRVLEQASGVPPAQILFLDDRPENVTAAQQLGWHAFVHHDPEATHRTFTELNLLTG